MDELRDEDGGGVEREAEDEHQGEADGEVAALEESEVEDGAVADAELAQLPPDHEDEGGDHGDDEEGDEVARRTSRLPGLCRGRTRVSRR